MGDDLCDLCFHSGVSVDRTTPCGKTIGIECGCDESCEDGTCNDDSCDRCNVVRKNGLPDEKPTVE